MRKLSVLSLILAVVLPIGAFAQSPTTPEVKPAIAHESFVGTWVGTQRYANNPPVEHTTTLRPDGRWTLEVWSPALNRGGKGEGTYTVEGNTVTLSGRYVSGPSGNLKYDLNQGPPGQLVGTGIGADNNVFNVNLKKK